jgi:5-oxopent-3-ene-1,2,5-tricarboxylate decarboxylase/2-hydroxyhepta-2,4-diene-1,7-dioate isomerase
MDRYKFDVGKVVCVIGSSMKDDESGFYIKPQGSIARDEQVVKGMKEDEELSFSMMLGVAISERIGKGHSSFMRSVLGLGVMFDHHIRKNGNGPLISHLRDPRNSGRDGFCTISEFIPLKNVGDPYSLEAYLQINDEEHLLMSTRDMGIRIEDALQNVSEFITLYPGDILGIWIDGTDRPARHGDLIEGGISSISTLSVRVEDNPDDRKTP